MKYEVPLFPPNSSQPVQDNIFQYIMIQFLESIFMSCLKSFVFSYITTEFVTLLRKESSRCYV